MCSDKKNCKIHTPYHIVTYLLGLFPVFFFWIKYGRASDQNFQLFSVFNFFLLSLSCLPEWRITFKKLKARRGENRMILQRLVVFFQSYSKKFDWERCCQFRENWQNPLQFGQLRSPHWLLTYDYLLMQFSQLKQKSAGLQWLCWSNFYVKVLKNYW